jgi:hypothetical protein
MLDEAEFRINKQTAEQVFALSYSIYERIRSRFLGSKLTLMILVSSIRYEKGPIASFIREIKPIDINAKVTSKKKGRKNMPRQ